MGLYHRENAQEDFLVLAGECLLIVEGEERQLQTWDFFHCPPGRSTSSSAPGTSPPSCWPSAHAAAGGRASSIPSRRSRLKHKAGVEQETTDPSEAYGSFADWKRSLYQEGWLPDL